MVANPYNLYRQQDLETSNPREIVGKLYSAAAVSLKKAVVEIRNKNLDLANNAILKAENIVAVLDKSLDKNYEISGQLHELYAYMERRMLEGNVKKETEILNEIAGLIIELRDAWEQAERKAK